MLFLIAVGIVAVMVIGMYNMLVRKRNQVQNVFASVDAILKKRYDLIPNLVAAVQQYMKHEQETLTEVTRLRAQALSGGMPDKEKFELDTRISEALRGIMVAVEKYPDLKANQNFIHLQQTLTEMEEQISAARRAYNATVTVYNNAVEMFPTNMIAKLFDFDRKTVFVIRPLERETADVHALFQR
ncbi:LemA family protein [Candidatus Eisenbacteria bacterium]|uniref:LemA family protein n=1 Tax=Eiseniibacteriota bacterium TaxID=2212470 RepID=A0ABV6YNM1_UNCEI